MKIHASSASSPARQAKSSVLLSFLAGAFLATSSAFATSTEIFNEELRDGSLPTGWRQTDLFFATTAGGFARMDTVGSLLITPEFDATAYDTVTVNFDVAIFSGGGDGPVTLEVSLDGGEIWFVVGDSDTPTGTTYISASLTIETLSDEMVLRFSRSGSPSQKRLRNVVVLGTPPVIEPILSAVTVGTIGFSSAEVEAEILNEGASAVTDRGFVFSKQAENSEPELSGPGVSDVVVGTRADVFTSTLTGLDPGTFYAVRAFATNGDGMSYSTVETFLVPFPTQANQETTHPIPDRNSPGLWAMSTTSPQEVDITHKDGRTMTVYLISRTETDFQFQRASDMQIFTMKIDDMCEYTQKLFATHWHPDVRFSHYVYSHSVRRCTVRRRSR